MAYEGTPDKQLRDLPPELSQALRKAVATLVPGRKPEPGEPGKLIIDDASLRQVAAEEGLTLEDAGMALRDDHTLPPVGRQRVPRRPLKQDKTPPDAFGENSALFQYTQAAATEQRQSGRDYLKWSAGRFLDDFANALPDRPEPGFDAENVRRQKELFDMGRKIARILLAEGGLDKDMKDGGIKGRFVTAFIATVQYAYKNIADVDKNPEMVVRYFLEEYNLRKQATK